MSQPRKKAKTPNDVPELGDPERKRVLNVLAQRRYRQRRREKVAELEAKTKHVPAPDEDRNLDEEPQACAQTEATSFSGLRDQIQIEEISRDQLDMGFSTDFDQPPIDFGPLISDIVFSDLPSPYHPPIDTTISLPSSATSRALTTTSSHVSPPTTIPSPTASFAPDSSYFQVPFMDVIRTFSSIAIALDLTPRVHDPIYLHTLSPFSVPANYPPNMQPTPAQLTIPHHPILDILPWPSVREKLICILSLPSAARPPIAQEDDGSNGQASGIVRLYGDIDCWDDGLRVHGCTSSLGNGNELVEEAWEIGEQFYRNWWWALETKIVRLSNQRRRERGLGPLRIK